jgi:acyl carrier protein
MQVTINMPDILTHERIFKIIRDIEKKFLKEGISFEIRDDSSTNDDSWDSLNLD